MYTHGDIKGAIPAPKPETEGPVVHERPMRGVACGQWCGRVRVCSTVYATVWFGTKRNTNKLHARGRGVTAAHGTRGSGLRAPQRKIIRKKA